MRWQAIRLGMCDELLSAYLDGELDASESEALERRLDQNPALQRELEAMRQTVTLLQELPDVQVPHNFILSTAATQQRARLSVPWYRRAWLAPTLTLLTTLVIVASTALLWYGSGPMAPMLGASVPPKSEPVFIEESSDVARESEEPHPSEALLSQPEEKAVSPPGTSDTVEHVESAGEVAAPASLSSTEMLTAPITAGAGVTVEHSTGLLTAPVKSEGATQASEPSALPSMPMVEAGEAADDGQQALATVTEAPAQLATGDERATGASAHEQEKEGNSQRVCQGSARIQLASALSAVVVALTVATAWAWHVRRR